jgi:hypothetical protein
MASCIEAVYDTSVARIASQREQGLLPRKRRVLTALIFDRDGPSVTRLGGLGLGVACLAMVIATGTRLRKRPGLPSHPRKQVGGSP